MTQAEDQAADRVAKAARINKEVLKRLGQDNTPASVKVAKPATPKASPKP